jgi:hypothetical protein
MTRRTKASRNPLEPYAFDTERRPFVARHRPVEREEQVGVHVTGDFSRACVYAMQRAYLQGDSIGIVLVLDVAGLEPLPDVDAVLQSETYGYAARELLDEIEDTSDADSVREAIDSLREHQEFEGEMPPDTWLDGAYAALDQDDQARLLQVLGGLDDDALMAEVQFVEEHSNFSLNVWMAVVAQARYMVPIGFDRLVEVRALRPVRHDLWGRGPDDPARYEQEYPDDDPEAPQVFTEENFFEGDWAPDSKTLWSRGREPVEPAYHGTDIVRARLAFPEIPLENPWEYTQS